MIPVSVVTGFLGSGKTTLIGRVLQSPGFARTAVIVNEFGEIGLDHDLIARSDETLMALTTGCLCCAVRGDLVETLLDLDGRRTAGEIAYDRVLIETSGLADPAPILHALMTDPAISAGHRIDIVATVVDAVHGNATLDRYVEARRQAALADRLLFSKTDLTGDPTDLRARLTAINPGAAIATTEAMTPEMLFAPDDRGLRALSLMAHHDLPSAAVALHSDGIETFSLVRDTPLPALALTLLLQTLTEHCGARLLRLKGLVDIEEMPGRPAVIHGVQHVFAAPVFLEQWPSDDRSTRIVFIAQGVPRYFPARVLAAIEAEVRDEMANS